MQMLNRLKNLLSKKPSQPTPPPQPITGQPSLLEKPQPDQDYQQPQPLRFKKTDLEPDKQPFKSKEKLDQPPQPQNIPRPPQPKTKKPEPSKPTSIVTILLKTTSQSVEKLIQSIKNIKIPQRQEPYFPQTQTVQAEVGQKPTSNLNTLLLVFLDQIEILITRIRTRRLYKIAAVLSVTLLVGISGFILLFQPEDNGQSQLISVTPEPDVPITIPRDTSSFNPNLPKITFTPRGPNYIPPEVPQPSPDELIIGEQVAKLYSDIDSRYQGTVTRIQTEQIRLIYVSALLPPLPFGSQYVLWVKNDNLQQKLGTLTRGEEDAYTLLFQESQRPETFGSMLNEFVVAEEKLDLTEIRNPVLQGEF